MITTHRIFVLAFLLVFSSYPSFGQDDQRGARFQKYQLAGIDCLNARNYKGALGNFEAALKEHETSWQTWQNVAICHSQLGDFQGAITDLQRSIELGGLHASQCSVMAGALEGLGEPKKALAWLQLACSVEPSQAANPVMQSKLRMLQDPMHCPTGSPDAADYLSSLANVRKWHRSDFPLRVFVRKNAQLPGFYDDYVQIVTDAFDQWCKASGGVVSYKFVPDKDSANVVCDYTDRRELVSSDHEPGIDGNTNSRVRMQDSTIDWANITILVKDAPAAETFRNRAVLTKCFLHEAGHALGMNGHSPNKHDVMFYCWTPDPIGKLSQRDKDTIRRIYQR